MRVCSSCGKPPANYALVRCSFCQGQFIEVGDITRTLSKEDIKTIASHVAKSWRFWVPFLIVLATACIAIWKGVGEVAKSQAAKLFNQEMTNRIRLEFQEPRISNLVAQAAASEAKSLMQSAIAPEIAKFQAGLTNLMNSLPTNLYSRVIFETIPAADTNRILRAHLTNGGWRVFVKLKFAPVANSLQGSIDGDFWPRSIPQPAEVTANVFVQDFSESWNFGGTVFTIHYIKDNTQTKLIQLMEKQNGIVFFDGVPVEIKPAAPE